MINYNIASVYYILKLNFFTIEYKYVAAIVDGKGKVRPRRGHEGPDEE
jgi:hypothetical protein